MSSQEVILSAPGTSGVFNLGSSSLVHRISSEQTGGAFSVVEFVSEPGEGVGTHVHQNEEELVYLLEGTIEVTVGEQSVTVPAGACALLPRGIPHGYVNIGDTPSSLLAVLTPGGLDRFFIELDREFARDREHEGPIGALCEQYGLAFIEQAKA